MLENKGRKRVLELIFHAFFHWKTRLVRDDIRQNTAENKSFLLANQFFLYLCKLYQRSLSPRSGSSELVSKKSFINYNRLERI